MTNSTEKDANINFRISEDERRHFKAWCATQGMTQSNAFREGYDLLRSVRNIFGDIDPGTIDDMLNGIQSILIDEDLDLCVEARGDKIWAVCIGRTVIDRNLEREHEPLPSSCSDDFIARTRFSLQEAMTVASRYRDKIHSEIR